MTDDTKPYCCFIDPDTDRRCEAPVAVTLIFGRWPDDYTESCGVHIMELVDDSVNSFTVVRGPLD